jgi:integrase
MTRLTKRSVDALTPGSGDYTVWDDDLAGFGVRVHPAGRKTFVLKYRVGGGRAATQRKMTLGTFGPVTVEQARGMARQAHADVVKGRDPAQERTDHRRADTFKRFADRYLEDHARPKKKPRSAAEDERLLNRHVIPKLGTRKVVDITTADIAKLVNGLAGTPVIANRVRALVSKMMSLATRWGIRSGDVANPAKAVEKFPEQRHERYLTVGELQALGRALTAAEKQATLPWQGIAAIRLLLLSGCRCGEILALRWELIDWERGFIMLADSKTGRKPVYLSAPLRTVLESLPSRATHGYVLPGRSGPSKPFVGLAYVWGRLGHAAGLRPEPARQARSKPRAEAPVAALAQEAGRMIEPVRIHDLRHTFASKGVGMGLSLRLVGGLLGHVSPLTTDRYAHLDADPVRQAAERVATVIGADLAGETGTVIPVPVAGRR